MSISCKVLRCFFRDLPSVDGENTFQRVRSEKILRKNMISK